MHNIPFLVVVTGASRGIGLELVKQYAMEGLTDGRNCKVIATCRDPDNAVQLQTLASKLRIEGDDSIVIRELDVTNEDSVQAFKSSLRGRPIDILINNAGMYGPNAPLLPVDIEKWHEVFHLNCVSPVYLTQQLFDNLKDSQLGKVVSISSDMGSIAKNTGGGAYLYRSSKAALNAAMYSLSLDVKEFGVTVMMLHPGHVKTDMGGPNAKVSVEESAAGLRKVIDEVNIDTSGAYRNWQGEMLDW